EISPPVVATLAPEARLLAPARDALPGLRVVVPDPDRSGANPAGDAHRAWVVVAPDAGHQSEIHRIRQIDRFRFITERRHGHDGAKDFFLAQFGRVIDPIEDGGLHVVAVVVALAGELVAAGDQPESFVHSVLDVLLHHALLVRG